MNPPTYVWQHYNLQGQVIGEIKRFIDQGGNKSDIPFYDIKDHKFKAGIPDELKNKKYPLFGLETFLDKNKPLIICEGQKAQSAFAGLGFQCVTSIMGANNAHLSDWSTIKDAEKIYLSPDNDEKGEMYIQAIYKILSKLPAQIKIIRLANLPEKGDICDWLKQRPELVNWNELESLKNHSAREILKLRLQQTIEDNLCDITSKSYISDWPDPEPLKTILHPVNPLPECLLPEPYRDWITDIAERMQCPKDFIATAAIVITASIIGAGCGIKPKQKDDWLVIPNLWGCIIGRPGMLKTPAVSEVMQIISQLEIEAKKEFDSKLSSYQVDLELYKAEKEALKNAMFNSKKQALKNKSEQGSCDILALKDQLIQLTEPKKPVWSRYKTNDATIEKLSELLSDNPRGLLIYRDELIGLLSSWDQQGRESDRAFFLEAWNGYGSLTTDRIGRGTVHTENLCVSIFGNTQPAKLSNYLYRAIRGIENDGLLQRFQLLIYPDEPTDWQLIDRKPNLSAKQRVCSIIRKLVMMDFAQHGAKKDVNDRFPYFRFDEEAQSLFYVWLSELEKEKLRQDDHPILLEHLAKYRSLLPSLALVFHLIDLADGEESSQVSNRAVMLAIGWCNYLEDHIRRIYGMVNDIHHQAAVKLAKKIQNGELTSHFSARDVYRKQWGLLDEKDVVQRACDELIELGWLRLEDSPYEMGRPRLPVYMINPKLSIQKQT